MAPDAERPGLLRRLARGGAELERQFETSVWPWAALTGLVLLVFMATLLIAKLGLGGDPFNDRAFDPAMWRASDGREFGCPRGEMLANLEGTLRVGTERRDLVALLGPPDAADQPRFASWYVGWWSGMRINVDSLDLQFDDQGRLTSWRRAQH